MPRSAKRAIREKENHWIAQFKLLLPVLERLNEDACRRERAGNRKLHHDQYAALILLYFFNPVVTSVRAIQQTSRLKKVQRLLRCSRVWPGSLSEAARVFDAELLRGIIGEWVETLRTYESICYYLSGLPDEEELLSCLQTLSGTQRKPPCRKVSGGAT